MMGNAGASSPALKTEAANEAYRKLLDQKQELTNELNNY